MKRILVPIDFSEQAEFAAKVAAKIARKTNSELYLLHMLELPTDIIDPSNYGFSNNSPSSLLYMKRAQEKFEKLTKRYYLRDIKIIKSVFFHNTFDGIIKESKEQNIDLIIMGSQGVSGFEEMFIGSNTEKVVRNSDVPVLVVKNEISDFELNNLIFASNFNEDTMETFQKVINFAKIFDAKVHLLKVNTAQNFEPTLKSKQKIKSYIANSDIENYTINIYNDVSVELGTLNFAEAINADLIALNTHKRRGLMNFFSKSISKDISNHSIRPVITFKLS